MFPERLKKKIQILNDLTLFDHYKSKDMYYSVECIYDSGDDSVKYYPAHNGYIWDTDHYRWYEHGFSSVEDAVKALERSVDHQLHSEFFWYYDKDKGYFSLIEEEEVGWGLMENPCVKSIKDVHKYYAKWRALCSQDG